MRVIAELQGSPENDNGRPSASRAEGEPATTSQMLPSAAHNDGAGRNVATMVLFLQPDAPASGASDEHDADVVVLPILRPANDGDAAPDVEALLREDPTFDAILDEARERWAEWLDARGEDYARETDANDEPAAPEGDDDHDCA
jgi:hypothetical protein